MPKQILRCGKFRICMVVCISCAVGVLAGAAAPAFPFQQTTAGSRPVKGDPQRGERIFTFKCNFCHSKIAAYGPLMEDLYKHPKLASGKPVTDETITDKIMNAGSDKMPAYRYTLSQQDLADLLSYLREGKCCPDPNNPSPNPRYREP